MPFTGLWEFSTYLLLLLCPGVPTLSCRSHGDSHSFGTACDERGIELFFLCPHTCVFQWLQSPLNNAGLSAHPQDKTLSFPGQWLPFLWLGFSNFCHIPAETWKQNSTEQPACGDIKDYTSPPSRYILSSFLVILFSIPISISIFWIASGFLCFQRSHPKPPSHFQVDTAIVSSVKKLRESASSL